MDVENPFGVAGCELLTENRHKACQNNHINVIFCQQLFDSLFKRLLATQFPLQNNLSGNPCICSPLQSVSIGIIGNHKANFTAVNHTACLGIDQRL